MALGQLITTPMGANAAVQNVLLGNGVTVSNISYSGEASAIGRFSGNTNIGLSEGIIITTGTINNVDGGPHGPNNSASAGVDNNAGGYGPLTAQAGTQTQDAAILEFDFVPFSDSVKFNYVFASEEYPEFVCSDFNDAFAFYISGPGIVGQKNMALIPNSTTPITINTVNGGSVGASGSANGCPPGGLSNTQYYVDNTNGQTIQYDGFTTVLTAESKVECGETYHLVIAIADAGDGLYDSGIFLEANSLSSDTPVEMTHQLSTDVFGNPDIMAEGCVSTTVTISRNNNLDQPLSIPLQVSGTATQGTDFTSVPTSINFNPGQSQVQFTIDALEDGITEGQESIVLTLEVIDPCGNPSPIVLTIYINDVDPVGASASAPEILCPGDSTVITAVGSGGGGNYTYLWNTGETTESITVTPDATTTYSVDITDDCLNQTATTTITVNVPVFPPLVLDETADITEICPYIPATISGNPTGGNGVYFYEWSTVEGVFSDQNSVQVVPSTTTTYTITVTDGCRETTTEEVVYTILSPPLVLEMSPNQKICPWDSTEISVASTGGYGQHFYLWPQTEETSSSIWVKPLETTTYTVIVSDECQTFTVSGTTTVEVVKPTANFTISSHLAFNNVPIQFQNLSDNAVSYEWDFGDNLNTSTLIHPQNTYPEPGFYDIELVAIDTLGCKDTIVKTLEIEEEWYVYIPNTFTPDENRFNNVFKASTFGIQTMEITIFNRWGELVFSSNDLNFEWDGTHKGKISPDGTYVYKVKFLTNSERQKNRVGHVNLLR